MRLGRKKKEIDQFSEKLEQALDALATGAEISVEEEMDDSLWGKISVRFKRLQEIWSEKEEEFAQTYESDGELPAAWTYIDTEEVPLQLSGKELLKEELTEEEISELEKELLQFLERENELRREVEVEENSIQISEEKLTFWIRFQTPRSDKKGVKTEYDSREGTYKFSLLK